MVAVELPGAPAIKMELVRIRTVAATGEALASLRLSPYDWEGYRQMSLWMFHTPPYIVGSPDASLPVVAYCEPA